MHVEGGAEFLITELRTGLTFAGIAARSSDPERARRSGHNARKAYDTAQKFLPSTVLTASELRQIDEKMKALKRALASLGELGE